MPGKTRTLGLADIPLEVPKIFDQAQLSIANHQKNYVALYKLQVEAARVTHTVNNSNLVKLTGERAFEEAFIHMVARILPIKKGPAPVDKVVKFVGGYTKFLNEKGMSPSNPCAFQKQGLILDQAAEEATKKEDDVEVDDDDTTASRFTTRLLRFLLKGCVAKDKAVRYRVLQLIAEMVSYLGEIECVRSLDTITPIFVHHQFFAAKKFIDFCVLLS